MDRLIKGSVIIMIVFLVSCSLERGNEGKAPLSPTEAFVIQELINKQGQIRTDLLSQKNVYLSESVGLWLTYLIEKDDPDRFAAQVKVLQRYFLKNEMVVWRIDGKEVNEVTAFIDDLRIIYALLEAGERWNEQMYIKLAEKLADTLKEKGMYEGVFVDFVQISTGDKPTVITMSYIIPHYLQKLTEHGLLSMEEMTKQTDILRNASLTEEGYLPKLYNVESRMYEYDEELHMIDQLYTALHKSQLNEDMTGFTNWLRSLYERDLKLYGRYDAKTGSATVSYESPSVYALAIIYLIEMNEDEFAQLLYEQMNRLKSDQQSGYVNIKTKETHAFDNLLPLLAERKIDRANDEEN